MEVHHHPTVEKKNYLGASEKFDCIAAERQKQLAIRLIALIKKEYNLE